MFKQINMKTISAAAVSLSLLAGTFVGPVSSAFAKPIEEKTSFHELAASNGVGKTRKLMIFTGNRYNRLGGRFYKSYRLGNRSIVRFGGSF